MGHGSIGLLQARFFKKGIVRWNVLSTMQPKGAKSVENVGDIIKKKTEKKSGKNDYFRKIRPCL